MPCAQTYVVPQGSNCSAVWSQFRLTPQQLQGGLHWRFETVAATHPWCCTALEARSIPDIAMHLLTLPVLHRCIVPRVVTVWHLAAEVNADSHQCCADLNPGLDCGLLQTNTTLCVAAPPSGQLLPCSKALPGLGPHAAGLQSLRCAVWCGLPYCCRPPLHHAGALLSFVPQLSACGQGLVVC